MSRRAPCCRPSLIPAGPRARKAPPASRAAAGQSHRADASSVIILVVSVGGYVVESWFDGSIARIHLNLGQNRPADAAQGSAELAAGRHRQRRGANGEYGDRAGERSDTTILAHLDGDGTTTNVSFPRDTLVTIPAYTDSKGVAIRRTRPSSTRRSAMAAPRCWCARSSR